MLLKNKKPIRKQLLLALHVKVGEKHLELCVALGSALTPFLCQHFISPLTSPKFQRPSLLHWAMPALPETAWGQLLTPLFAFLPSKISIAFSYQRLFKALVFLQSKKSNLNIHVWIPACMHATSLQSCLTLCNPMDCSLPGSSVHGILQARVLEWVALLHGIFPNQGSNLHLLCLLH